MVCLGGRRVDDGGTTRWSIRDLFKNIRDTKGTFHSISDSDHRVPAGLGQESQASSCLSNGTLLASRVVHGMTGLLSSCVWNLRVFPDAVPVSHVISACGRVISACSAS